MKLLCIIFLLILNSNLVFVYGGDENVCTEETSSRSASSSTSNIYCRLLINEFNTHSPNPAPSLFIELRRVYTEETRFKKKAKNLLQNQYVVILRANPLSVVFYADLSNQELMPKNEAEFFVLGDPGLPLLEDRGIPLNHPAIQSIYKNTGSERLLPAGDDSAYAILLLYSGDRSVTRKRDINWMQLEKDSSGMYRERRFAPSEINRFRDLITDAVVYGKKVPASTCGIFDQLFPDNYKQPQERTFMLRDWDVFGRPDYSMARCTSGISPFEPFNFQYDKPSAGLKNLCVGVLFYIENAIDHIAPLQNLDKTGVPACSSDLENIPPGRYKEIDESKLADYRENRMQLAATYPQEGGGGTIYASNDLAINNGEIKDRGGTAIVPEVEVLTKWNTQWVKLAEPYLPPGAHILQRTNIQQWLRILQPTVGSSPISFQCGACNKQFAEHRSDVSQKPLITSDQGYFNANPHKNSEAILKHAKDKVHLDAVSYAYNLAISKSIAERERVKQEYENRYDQRLLPTVRMVRTVFAEAVSEVPFMYHPIFVDMQEGNGVNLGFHHYHDRSAKLITTVISDTMHTTMLNRLIRNDKPFSLVADASTTTTNIPYLIIYIQTLEDNLPITYYYRIVELAEGETAKKTFDAFWNAVEQDDVLVPGFKDYILRRLSFLSTDNAKVMIGRLNSFLTHLNQKLGRDVVSIGCMAHKASLSIKSAIRQTGDPATTFIQTFEHNLNDLYIFYASRGSKRLQHLARLAKEYGMALVTFKKNIEVRWAAAEAAVIDAILTNMPAVKEDLLAIQIDPEFTAAAKKQAETLFSKLTDLPTVTLFYEFSDFLQINQIMSKTFQSESGILVDYMDTVKRAMQDYEKLQNAPGKGLSAFLATCNCHNICRTGTCNLKQVEDCNNPICGDTAMERIIEPTFKLNVVRYNLYSNIIASMKNYFNFELFNAFIVADNRHYNDQFDPADFTSKFDFICDFMGFQRVACNRMHNNYFRLIRALQMNPLYSATFNNPPSKFWPTVLENFDGSLDISEEVRYFLLKLLSMSGSSSTCERGFSFMTRIASGARSILQPDTLDALLRIKINCMKQPSEIDAFLYAKRFTEKHYFVDDKKAGGRKKVTKDNVYGRRVSRLF